MLKLLDSINKVMEKLAPPLIILCMMLAAFALAKLVFGGEI